MKWNDLIALNCTWQRNGKIANYSLSLIYSHIHSLTDEKVTHKINLKKTLTSEGVSIFLSKAMSDYLFK